MNAYQYREYVRLADAGLSRTTAHIYFDPKTQRYARATIHNIREGTAYKFDWQPQNSLYERHRTKIAMLHFVAPPDEVGKAAILPGVGSVRRSKVHPGLLLYTLYKDNWRKE